MLDLFRQVVNGKSHDYEIKDPHKLESVAKSLNIGTEGRSVQEMATDVYNELERTYTQIEGEIPFASRVPQKTLELWRKYGGDVEMVSLSIAVLIWAHAHGIVSLEISRNLPPFGPDGNALFEYQLEAIKREFIK